MKIIEEIYFKDAKVLVEDNDDYFVCTTYDLNDGNPRRYVKNTKEDVEKFIKQRKKWLSKWKARIKNAQRRKDYENN